MKSSNILMVTWMYFALVAAFVLHKVAANNHVAQISMQGLRATINFVPGDSAVNITVSLNCEDCVSSEDTFQWSIQEYPMLYDKKMPCSEVNIGPMFSDGGGSLSNAHGPLNGSNLLVAPQSFLNTLVSFDGKNSISGRTLLFEKTNSSIRYCASITPVADVRTAVSTFQYPVAGRVTFRQQIGQSETRGTSIYVDLDVIASPQNMNLNWHIRSNNGLTADMDNEQQCEALNDESSYDLSGTFRSLVIGTVSNHQSYYFFHPNISLEGANSIVNMSLVLNGSTTTTCNQIKVLVPRTVTSLINAKDITGVISFSQKSPWEYTSISVNLTNLRSLIGGYHVHEYPIPPRYAEGDNLADVNAVAGHFNPFGIIEFPEATVGTEDQYEVGDISNKFGSLTAKESVAEEYTDWNMPLFGTNSVIGLSVVLHLAENNSRYAYGQISYPTEVKTVVVDFQFPVTGRIVMKQDQSDPLSETTVFVDIANVEGTSTVEHNWHVHVNKINNDYIADSGRCIANGGHYNPFKVDLNDGYSECSPLNPRRCEAGDFSGKHGKLSIASTLHTSDGKFFFTDVQLPLSGAYSIDARSVVIHEADSGAGRLSCQNTFGVLKKYVNTTIWSDTQISGSIVFSQGGGLSDPTEISVNIFGLSNNANGWHVHVLPVPLGNDIECSVTQGHFNPFNIIGSPPASTLDLYEVGDLSGKFVTLEGKAKLTETFVDQTITLRGPHSIDARSVVVHRNDDGGTRWSCTTLKEVLPPLSFGVTAVAKFTNTAVSGTITFRQTHQGNDYLADTIIYAALVLSDSVTDAISSWSVLNTTDVSNCGDGSQVYDPFNIKNDAKCSLARQGQCIMGNLGRRHGAIPDGGAIFTDTNLPLIGQLPNIGRVLRLEVDGKAFCSRIQPIEEQGRLVVWSFPTSVKFDPYKFRLVISTEVTGVDMWQIVVPESPNRRLTLERCQTVEFWVIGSDPDQIVDDISAATNLGEYTPGCLGIESTTPSHTSTTKAYTVTICLSFVIFILVSFM